MIKYFVALITIVLFTSAFILKPDNHKRSAAIELINTYHVLSIDPTNRSTTPIDSVDIPEEIISPSYVGEVIFPHLFHYEDLEIECKECHHEINAAKLNIPHEEYFKDFWIDCNICHNGDNSSKMEAHDCSDCHHSQLTNIADETLSAKVVIHENCWTCHDIGRGQDASNNCEVCHSGEKLKYD